MRLLNFIESNDFIVEIMGHSCGLSNRVMLNMIYEHHNRRGIIPYYYSPTGTDEYEHLNYKTLSQNISRHFNKKGLIREKLLELEKCQHLPQHEYNPEE